MSTRAAGRTSMSAGAIKRGRVRLEDIAKEIGVSRAVVGRVLLGSGDNIRVSRQKARLIRQVAKRMRYRPNQIARQLGGKSSQLLGVLMGAAHGQSRHHRLVAVEAEARRRGYRIIIGLIADDCTNVDSYVDTFDSYNVEAMLYLDTRFDVSQRLLQFGPVVSSVRLPGHDICYVEMDRAEAGRLGTEHMLARGRKRVALVVEPDPWPLTRVDTEKRRGFLEALAAHGLDYGLQTIYRPSHGILWTMEETLEAVDHLVGKLGCDAIICVRDILAVHLLKALRRRGLRVPEDVALMGFDNLDLSTAVDPELTSIDHRHEQCAKVMLDLVVRMKEDPDFAGEQAGIEIPPLLVVRQST